MENNITTFGVVYPGVENYLNDYFSSLSKQSFSDFDIWIINDGLQLDVINFYKNMFMNLNINIFNLNSKYTIPKVREIGINYLLDKYDYIVFTDVDDFISANRIESSVKTLSEYDFCYNDMFLTDNKGKLLSETSYFVDKNAPIKVNDFLQLLDKNFCGFSHTAVNLKRLELKPIEVPDDIIAVDWWFYSYLLMNGFNGCFDSKSYTYYRQHQTNTVGGLNIISEKSLLQSINVKKKHYKSLLQYDTLYNDIIDERLKNILELEARIIDKSFLTSYLESINKEKDSLMWWEIAK